MVLDCKAGAVWKEVGVAKTKSYDAMFNDCGEVSVEGLGKLAYYPNRDSLGYIGTYGLQDTDTFVRTTLRYPDFCKGWSRIVGLELTDETVFYETNGLSVAAFFAQHLANHSLDFALNELPDEILSRQLHFLGLDSIEPLNRGTCTAADVLQYLLETRLALHPKDKDMIVMLHEIAYEQNGQQQTVKSELVVKGEDSLHTAMAKTVGLPLGIAATLLLEGSLKETGLHIPIIPTIYKPVLEALETQGIRFTESFELSPH